MTIFEPDFIRLLDTSVTTKLLVLFTVLLSKVAFMSVSFVGEIMIEAIGLSAEMSLPIFTIKLSVVIAKGGLIMLSSLIVRLFTNVLLVNKLLIVNYRPETVQVNPEGEMIEPSDIVMSTELQEGLTSVYCWGKTTTTLLPVGTTYVSHGVKSRS